MACESVDVCNISVSVCRHLVVQCHTQRFGALNKYKQSWLLALKEVGWLIQLGVCSHCLSCRKTTVGVYLIILLRCVKQEEPVGQTAAHWTVNPPCCLVCPYMGAASSGIFIRSWENSLIPTAINKINLNLNTCCLLSTSTGWQDTGSSAFVQSEGNQS